MAPEADGSFAVRIVETRVRGRYLWRPAAGESRGLLVGFHGYGESAEHHLAELERLPGAERLDLVAIQGLHRFYKRRTGEVVASWMTREDRDLAIEDNLTFVAKVLDELITEAPDRPLAMIGFSQGVAMTYRAAAAAGDKVSALVAIAGDVPPEVAAVQPRLPDVFLARGLDDSWYDHEQLERDRDALKRLAPSVDVWEFDGGHEWTDPLRTEIGAFLDQRLS